MSEDTTKEFFSRLNKHHDELRQLYMTLYNNGSMFYELMERIYDFYLQRSQALKLKGNSQYS